MEILTGLIRMFGDMWAQFAGVYEVCMGLGFLEPWPCARTAAISMWADYGAMATPAIMAIMNFALAFVGVTLAAILFVATFANFLISLFLDPPHR